MIGQSNRQTLARAAGMLCANPVFQKWCGTSSSEDAAAFVREFCGIQSRRQLDTNSESAARFHTLRRRFVDRPQGESRW